MVSRHIGIEPQFECGSGRTVHPSGRQTKRGVISDRNDGLDRAVSERMRADELCPTVCLQGGGDDFAAGSTAVVHEDDHWKLVPLAVAFRVVRLALVRGAPLCGEHNAGIKEDLRDTNGLREEASRVVAQIQDQAIQGAGLLQ